MCALSLSLTVSDAVDWSPPASPVHGILQARMLEWAALSSSRDLPSPGIEPRSLASQADSSLFAPPGKPPDRNPGVHV